MNAENERKWGVAVWLGALFTMLILVGGLVIGVFFGSLLNESLPMHVPEATRSLFSALPVLGTLAFAGACWGYVLGRVTGSPYRKRMALAGGLCYGLAIILVALSLTFLEVQIVEKGLGPDIQVHNLYTLLFVPGTFIVAAAGSLGLGLANKKLNLAIRLAIFAGLASAASFLIINLTMDALGWRVGAPGAAERATMLTVTLVGCLGAALAGGAVTSLLLRKEYLPQPV
ncbi:MAG: hypothetical protein A2Z16_13930 [Chloroflexi bacterium RBG_16_54_18]|nr:MAG: hypothetical protein A2Z16_13930 [Chloroflexi bacterium RBG_16_54_18]